MKTCSKCLKTYPATKQFFGPSKHCKDKLHSYCRECRRTEARERKRLERSKEAIGEEMSHIPQVPIQKTLTETGTIVKFGRGWKPQRPEHKTLWLGYNSPLTRIL